MKTLIFTIGLLLCVASCVSQASSRQSSTWGKEEIYIDDDVEGSGAGSTRHRHRGSSGKDDLESSGSGLGPDDEDSDGPDVSMGGKWPETSGDKDRMSKGSEAQPTHSSSPDDDDGIDEAVPTVTKTPGSSDDGSVMGRKHEDRPTSFFAQPGILAAVIGGAVVGLLCAILLVMFIVYRMRKKDEGSYALEEPKRSPTANSYNKPNREFYA